MNETHIERLLLVVKVFSEEFVKLPAPLPKFINSVLGLELGHHLANPTHFLWPHG